MTMLIHIFEILTLGLVLLAAYRGHYHYNLATQNAFASTLPSNNFFSSLAQTDTTPSEIVRHHPDNLGSNNISKSLSQQFEKPHLVGAEVKKDNALNDYIGDFF